MRVDLPVAPPSGIGGWFSRWPWVWRTALGLAIAAHLVTLYLPGSPPGPPGLEIPYLDKLIHVVAFGVPVFLGCVVARRSWPVWVFALHAPLSELIQWRFIPLRDADPRDAFADVIGIGFAWLAYRIGSRTVRASARPPGAADGHRA